MSDVDTPKVRFSMVLRFLAFVTLLVAGLLVLSLANFDLETLQGLVQETEPLAFLGFMSLLPLAGFPISVFYLYAGSAFPWWQATFYCSLSLAINMGIAYPLARHLLAIPLNQLLARHSKRLPTLTEDNQFRLTFLVRSVPGIPFFLQNYLLSLLGVRFGPYLLVSWAIQTVFAAGMAAIPHAVQHTGWIPLAMVISVFFLLAILRRVFTGKSLTNQEPPKL